VHKISLSDVLHLAKNRLEDSTWSKSLRAYLTDLEP